MKRLLLITAVMCLFTSKTIVSGRPYYSENKSKPAYDRSYHFAKGIVNLRIGFPWVNTFNFNYQALGEISNIGFMGLSLGVDYLYLDRSFVSVSGAGIMDFLLPFPAPIDYGGIKDHSLSLYGSVSNNHLLIDKRFSVGYGLSFGNDVWNTINHDHWSEDAPQELVEQESVSRQSHSLGLVFPVYYYSKKNFYCGFVYRPMLLQFIEEARWTYQHTVSFDFGWQIRLNKR